MQGCQRGAGGGEHLTWARAAPLRGLPRDLGKVGCSTGGKFQGQTCDVVGEAWKGHSLLLGIASTAMRAMGSCKPLIATSGPGPTLEVQVDVHA